LTPREVAGFRLFTGKAGCLKCHSGFAFTDHAFYDIGLPGEDRGRGAVLRLEAAEHAFKTPGLREIRPLAPYMHDGSLATLEDVLRPLRRRPCWIAPRCPRISLAGSSCRKRSARI
jgi:cytochrome c peroxidase